MVLLKGGGDTKAGEGEVLHGSLIFPFEPTGIQRTGLI